MDQRQTGFKGFTLAELLISLALLGVIATFTIPKILSTQQNEQFKAESKEAVSMVAAACQQYSLSNGLNTSVKSSDLTQYMNFVKVDTSTVIDGAPADGGTQTCGGTYSCLSMHNGGILAYVNGESFGGNGTSNGIVFLFDPDGKVSNSQSFRFYVLYSGRIIDDPAVFQLPGQNVNSSLYGYDELGANPSWFSWK